MAVPGSAGREQLVASWLGVDSQAFFCLGGFALLLSNCIQFCAKSLCAFQAFDDFS